MAKLRALAGGKGKEKTFSLVYGLRLYPAATVSQVTEDAAILRDGSHDRVPLHLIEGTREQIHAQLLASIDAFFDMHSEDVVEVATPTSFQGDEVGEAGC
jgi:hypothetical protein